MPPAQPRGGRTVGAKQAGSQAHPPTPPAHMLILLIRTYPSPPPMTRPSLRPSALGLSLTLACLSAHAAPPSSPDVQQLDAVQVLGRAQTLYRVDDATVGTRTDTPLALVPQSIQVVPRELIEDQAARQITDLYRSISGVSFFSYAGVTLRGFRQENVLYDGLRGDPYAGFSVPQLFNIERVEVLKGPAGALYGGGDAGGVINYVTRKPKATPERRIELQAGNNDSGLRRSRPPGR